MRGLVVVPVYNEIDGLPTVIEELGQSMPGDSVLFVNDGSTDGSERVLHEAGVRYVTHPVNLGYQEALRTGMLWALRGGHDFVAFFDSDGQHRTEDLERLIRAHRDKGHDLIIGSRYRDSKASSRFSLRSLGTWAFSKLTTLLAGGVEITDATNGLKLISRRFIPVALELPAEDMHAEFIIGMAWCGAEVAEEPIEVRRRMAGDSMYSLRRGLVYPIKTFFVVLVSAMFAHRVRSALDPVARKPPTGPFGPEGADA